MCRRVNKKLLNNIKNEKPLKLLIAGKGKKTNIENGLYKLHLTDCARLIGSYNYEMMPKIHNLVDIFVLPSIPTRYWQEQFGYVLVESMSCGKPVVTTTCGSIPEVVDNAGVVVPTNDFISLYKMYRRINSRREKEESTLEKRQVQSRIMFQFSNNCKTI